MEIRRRFRVFPVVAILGPRQCGKTTLARKFKSADFFDLENPVDLARLDHPMQALNGAKGLVVIDEIQRKPDLFPVLRHWVDTHRQRKLLILGSASRDLIQQSSETLAGRISFFNLSGFTPEEVGLQNFRKLWLRGGFPRSFLAKSQSMSFLWRQDYIASFLERDIPQLGITIPAQTLRRFWTMIAHFHGQLMRYSEIARSFGISDMTVRRYLEILEGTFMVRSLQPWHANLGKRLVKHPKIYLSDSGIFHALMDIRDDRALLSHPKLGASWEGFVHSVLEDKLKPDGTSLYFWATHAGAELDFFWRKGTRNYGVEAKFSDAPTLTPSMRISTEDLGLDHLYVVYPGDRSYSLGRKIDVLSFHDFTELKI